MGPYTIPVTGTTITTGVSTDIGHTTSGTVASGNTYLEGTGTITIETASRMFNDYAPYVTTDHYNIVTNASEIDKIKDILSDICDLLADLYEKERLGRNNNLDAIRMFLDSIKVTEE